MLNSPPVEEWEVRVTDEWLAWFQTVDHDSQALIVGAIDRLADAGPSLGRPLVDRVKGASVHNMKEFAARVERPVGDSDLVRVRPVPVGDLAGRCG